MEETADPLLGSPPPTALTHVFLCAPTAYDHDQAITTVAGNIVPAVQGQRRTETFSIPDPATPAMATPAMALVRVGANWTPQDPQPDYRFCLTAAPVAWLATTGPGVALPAVPEILLRQVLAEGSLSPWAFRHWLLDAGPADHVFTLTPEQYSPVLTSDGTTWLDYDGDGGTTIRFGDGTSGQSPRPGTQFSVVYRVGGGSAGNVAAGAISNVTPGQPQGWITACTNPFPATGGEDAETMAQILARAPQQFTAEPLRAVLASDYQAAAQSLPWVRQAAASFRWTGSWLTVLTQADPAGTEEPSVAQLVSLTELLEEERLAGYESYVLPPGYVSIDLTITVTARQGYSASTVAAAVLARLQPGIVPGAPAGFFDHSQWSFGQPLESSALMAAIQSSSGVDGVDQVLYRRRGAGRHWAPLPDRIRVGAARILRLDNDPSRPKAGSLRVRAEAAT